MTRTRAVGILAGVLLLALAGAAQAQKPATNKAETPLFSTGVTGSIGESGLDDPQYVLSFIPVQRLMLEATHRPLSKAEIEGGLKGTPVTLDRLLQLELLRKEGDSYWLNYLLLTRQDQETMYRVGERYGRSLADAFRGHQGEFDHIMSRYPDAGLRPQLMFALVAGAALNWGGLELTSELGYRVKPPRHANGRTYFVHSAEGGVQLDFRGLYSDSQTAPGPKMVFSTFGDGDSLPRMQGLPDVFDGIDQAVEGWKKAPDLYGALRDEYIALLLLSIDDAGQIMDAVARGANTDAALAAIPIPEERRNAMVKLLLATGYLREENQRYAVGVPMVTERDQAMVDDVLNLSRTIMKDWLRKNYPEMKAELGQLSPMRNGVPFSLVFSEVWHYEFGFAAKSLAESGFYANPRAPGNRYEGYVPLVWERSVLKLPQ